MFFHKRSGLLLWAVLLCALLGCSKETSSALPSQVSAEVGTDSEVILTETALTPGEAETRYQAVYTEAPEGTVLAAYGDQLLLRQEEETVLWDGNTETAAPEDAVGFMTNEAGTYLALGSSNPVTAALPDGQQVELTNSAGFQSSTGAAYVHFAADGNALYILNEYSLYRYQDSALTELDETVWWRGLGKAGGSVYAVGSASSGSGESTVREDYLFQLSDTGSVCLGKLEVDGTVQQLCGTDTLYLVTDQAVYSLDQQAFICLGTLIGFGIPADTIVDAAEASDGLRIAVQDGCYTLRAVQESSEGGGDLVTLTVGYISDSFASFPSAMAAFNRSQTDIQIDAVEYDSIEACNLAIITGNLPDIICIGSESSNHMQVLAGKDVLLPLNSFLEAENAQGDYFESVLSACALDGQIYYICPFFTLFGVDAPANLTEGVERFATIDDLDRVFQSLGENAYLWLRKSDMLGNLISDGFAAFVDYGSNTASFETEQFYEILRFCNRFAASQSELVLDEAMPFRMGTIYSPRAMVYTQYYYEERSSFGGGAAFFPLPLSPYDGYAVFPSYLIGITASTQHEEAAYEFLRFLLSDEMQSKAADLYYIPLSRTVCLDLWEQASTPNPYAPEENAFYKTCEDKLLSMIEDADHLYAGYSLDIIEIIQEEAAAYFAGDRSVEDAAHNIQIRVELYLAEQG